MPYGYNRDAENIQSIGSDFGTIVGTFIRNKRLNKSRLALEREQKEKTDALIAQKSHYLKQQLGPDDTDLYNQLTENPTPESIALAEPEIERRSKSRADQAKADEAAKKELDKKNQEEEKIRKKSEILTKIINDDETIPPDKKGKFISYLDGTDVGYEAAHTLYNKFDVPKEAKQSIAEQKAAVMDDILSLGDNDLARGMEMAKTNYADLYRAALKFGIKADKKEDPAADYVKQVISDWSESDEHTKDAMPLEQYAKKWIQEREAAIPVEARTALLDTFNPERKSGGLMEGMKQAGFVGGSGDGDAKKAQELSAKLHADPSSLTDEELDWLDAYHKRQSGAAN